MRNFFNESNEAERLFAISPIDGRYGSKTEEGKNFFSEAALIKFRMIMELKWLEKLLRIPQIATQFEVTEEDIQKVEELANSITNEDIFKVKEIERTTNHDVKSVEFALQEKFCKMNLEKFIPLIHFGITSEDCNNIAYGLMINGFINSTLHDMIYELIEVIDNMAALHAEVPMLGHTHGQSATPTTVGHEFKVYASRMINALIAFDSVVLTGKLNGAVGCYNSFVISYPEIDWIEVSKEFVESLGLKFNQFTTQIENHDNLFRKLSMLKSANNILIDMCQDIWLYVSMGYFKQKVVSGEVGSSVMPHKVNPILFEGAIGNLRIANSLIDSFASLEISKMQRDLSDSTIQRNIGMCLCYTLSSIKDIIKGLAKLEIHEKKLKDDLENNPEVLSEAIQTILRKNGVLDAYNILKGMTRGKTVTLESLREFVRTLDINEQDKERLINLTPETYIGLAGKIAKMPLI